MKMLFCFLLGLYAVAGYSQSDDYRKKNFNLDDGVAIRGYDPVSYFTLHKAVRGKRDFSNAYHGVDYYFANAADKEIFQADPVKYEPQFGGWCAYAMGSDGSKVEVDPETFKIIDGKLFLFYNRFFNNTLKTWNKDEARLHMQADANWQKIIHH